MALGKSLLNKHAFCIACIAILACALAGAALHTVIELSKRISTEESDKKCDARLKGVALGLYSYSANYGCFPPSFTVDSKGMPLHSWRTLICGHLDNDIHEFIQINEPWNSRSNSDISKLKHTSFQCPNIRTEGNFTNYLMLTNDKNKEIGSRKHRYFILIEVLNSKIQWMKPRDIALGEISEMANDDEASSTCISSNDLGGAAVWSLELRRLPTGAFGPDNRGVLYAGFKRIKSGVVNKAHLEQLLNTYVD